MAAIAIKDLRMHSTLDFKARSSIRGAGGGWVFGWIRPYVDAASRIGSVINFYQTNNFFVADQMNNQIQVIDVDTSGTNATVNVAPKMIALNHQQ